MRPHGGIRSGPGLHEIDYEVGSRARTWSPPSTLTQTRSQRSRSAAYRYTGLRVPNDLGRRCRSRTSARLPSEGPVGVAALHVFGSVARGESRPNSDIDVLVEFDGPRTFARFIDLKLLLEDTLGARVDLVARAALRSQLKPRIEAEARRVA